MTRLPSALRVALVHDWLVTWGGSESVLKSFAEHFPDAPIFTSLWDPVPRVAEVFGHRDIRTTWVQKLHEGVRNHRRLLPLMPAAFRSLDLSEFDLVISDSHAFSKGVSVRPDALHVCYCHTPPRYLWDLQEEYLGRVGRIALAPLFRWLRKEDLAAAQGVTHFVANSDFVRERIERVYRRDARVIHPPVDVEGFSRANPQLPSREREYFLAGGRLVPYKRVHLPILAANQGGYRLKVFGDGPEKRRLERIAGPTVEFLGALSTSELAEVFAGAIAYVFPGVEDFGILPVEAQAAATPVLAFREGGALETVQDGTTGLFFDHPTVESLVEGIGRMEGQEWDRDTIRENAKSFSKERFLREVVHFLDGVLKRGC